MVTRKTTAKPKRLTAKQKAEADRIKAEELREKERAERRKFTVRILALFLASGMAVITTGAAIGVEIWKSVLMGGAAGIAQLAERLARSAVRDGNITKEDLEEALNSMAE